MIKSYVKGQSRHSTNFETIEVIDPSTASLRLKLSIGSEEDVDFAVSSCRESFEDGRWSSMPPSAKKAILHRFSDLISASADELDALDAGEMGKPVSLKHFGAEMAAGYVRINGEAIDKLNGDLVPSD